MKRKAYILILISLIQHCFAFSQNVGIIDSIYFYKAVQEGIEKYINKIPLGKEKDFGFNSHVEFSNILIEEPMQIYSFTDYSFQSSDKPNLFQPLKRWTVPLSINHEYKCFIDITIKDDGYKAIGFGSALLATDLNNYENNKNLKNE